VDDHFGHCEAYTIFTVNEMSEILYTEMLPSPQGCGCKSNIASILREKGVDVMLAGNMGNGALTVLTTQGIEVYRGNKGDINKLVEEFLAGGIKDSGQGCEEHDHHGESHQCTNH